MNNLNSNGGIDGPTAICNLLEAVVPSEGALVLVTLDSFIGSINNISFIYQDEVEDAFDIVQNLADLGNDNFVLLSGSRYLRTPEHKDLIAFISDHAILLDDLVVDWTKQTMYSAMCEDPTGCCGPDNQIDYVKQHNRDTSTEVDIDQLLQSLLSD